MEASCLLIKEDNINTAMGKGFSLRERSQKTRRKTLSEITNFSINEFTDGVFPEDQEKGKIESPKTVNEYIAMLLKESNALMRAVEEGNEVIEMSNAEVQRLRLMVAKTSQQNWQLSQANSIMLAEINLAKERLKVAQHELGCQSAALRAKTLELEEQKAKINKHNKLLPKISSIQDEEIKPVETEMKLDPCHLHLASSQKKACPPNRKRTQRSQSLGPMPITSLTTRKEKDENRRKPSVRRKSMTLKVECCEPSEELFEIPLRLGEDDEGDPKDEERVVQGRSSIGRPLRKAAERVYSYKELPLTAKLRRS